jgi:DNA-directed RNA polymerase II subunit RPB2
MLHSDICILKNQGSNVLRQLGECPYDTGGYFIIDGKEKVIIAQEKIVTNKLFVNKLKDDDNGFSHKGVIRCVSDKGALAPHSVEFYYVDTPLSEKGLNNEDDVEIKYETAKKYIYGSILLSLPSFNGKIPLFILFRAFGIVSDKEIYKTIFGDNLNSVERNYFDNFIRPSVISSFYTNDDETYNVYTQEEALKYLRFHVKYGTLEHAKSVLTMEIFPNIDDFGNKGKYLGYLVLQFIKTVINVLPLSDRDSYIYKRVDISGFMLAELFQEAYQKLRDSIRNTMDSMYYYGSWKQQDNYENFITENNIYKLVSAMLVTETFGKSLKGRWGLVSNEDPELGKVQDLSRISYIGYMSHLRRVNIPIDRSIKITGPHRLHSQQWGMMCPFESPDGGSIGYLKNLSLLAKITAGINIDNIKECLVDIGVVPLSKANIYNHKNITNVFLNGSNSVLKSSNVIIL